jgi:hypothetical protein
MLEYADTPLKCIDPKTGSLLRTGLDKSTTSNSLEEVIRPANIEKDGQGQSISPNTDPPQTAASPNTRLPTAYSAAMPNAPERIVDRVSHS